MLSGSTETIIKEYMMHQRVHHSSAFEHIVKFDVPTENYIVANHFQSDVWTNSHGIELEIFTTSIFDPTKAMIELIYNDLLDSHLVSHDLHGEPSDFIQAEYSDQYQIASIIQPILDGQFWSRVGWVIYRKSIPIETILTTLKGITNEIRTATTDSV